MQKFLSKCLFVSLCFQLACKTSTNSKDKPFQLLEEGQQGGNGGNIIFCVKSKRNHHEGFLSLDYVHTDPLASKVDALEPIENWEWERMYKQLHKIRPDLGGDFYGFVMDFKKPDADAKYHWSPLALGVTEISDGSMAIKVPENCLKDGKPNLRQAVKRYPRSNNRIGFYYDPIVADLQKKVPMQFSFVFVHEWLWNIYFSDANKNIQDSLSTLMEANRYLHSKEFQRADLTNKDIQELIKAKLSSYKI